MFAVSCYSTHHHKSASTLSLSKESAKAGAGDFAAKEMAAKYALQESQSSRKSSNTTLVGNSPPCSVLSGSSASPHTAWSSLECLPDSVTRRVALFNDCLPKISGTNIYLVPSPEQLKELLDLNYGPDNKMSSSDSMFPYLHGLTSLKESIYFDDRFNPATDMHLLTESSQTLLHQFPQHSFPLKHHFGLSLMTVRSCNDAYPMLVNSISMEEVLTMRTCESRSPSNSRLGYEDFESFSNVRRISESQTSQPEYINRNYSSQIKLMASVSDFLVYNNGMDLATNTQAAKLLSHLMGPSSPHAVYVVDFESPKWSLVQPYIENIPARLHLSTEVQLGTNSIYDMILALEQNLIWQASPLSQIYPRLYAGNIYEYQQMMSVPSQASHYDFRLHIHCHEHAPLPSMSVLSQIMHFIASENLENPLYVEFPDSLAALGGLRSSSQKIRFLNMLKIINLAVNQCNTNVFVYSHDGPTGTTMLLTGLGLFWGSDHLEDVVQCLFSKPSAKHQLKQGDFAALKSIQPYIQWFKRQSVKQTTLLTELSQQHPCSRFRPFTRTIDWFSSESQVNFPSQIYDNLFLGSADHASSATVLSALRITKIISIGEQPRWFGALDSTFEHEADTSSSNNILKPIFTFNNGQSRVYEIHISSKSIREKLFRQDFPIPKLESVIYIHNLRDDGKDSILPLLVGCPEWLQHKILVNPKDSSRTLIHCRIGVSRSATLAIASVMKHHRLGVFESYLHVRVRRFNVIIQPNLRFFYELFLFNQDLRESSAQNSSESGHPDFSWWIVCESVHRLNLQYIQC